MTTELYRPDPMLNWDGELTAPWRVLVAIASDRYDARVFGNGVDAYNARPVLRRMVAENETNGTMVLVDAERGRVLPFQGRKILDKVSGLDPNRDYTIRVDNGTMRPDWFTLHYSTSGLGWTWYDVDVDDLTHGAFEPFDDEGYPKACERCDNPGLAEIDEEKVGTGEIDWSMVDYSPVEYYADGIGLCSRHFDEWSGESAYVDSDDWLDIQQHTIASGRGTFSTQPDERFDPTRADWSSVVMVWNKRHEIAETELREIKSHRAEWAFAAFGAGMLDRPTTLANGVAEFVLDRSPTE